MISAESEHSTEESEAVAVQRQPATVAINPAEVVGAFQQPEPAMPLDCLVEAIAPAQQTPTRTAACPVCGCCSARPLYAMQGDAFSLVVCLECGLGQLHPRPEPARIPSFYPPEYYGAGGEKFLPLIELAIRKAASRQARELTRGLPAGSRVLDVGCGRGTMLGALASRGFEAHGFDISETASQGAAANTHVHVADSLPSAALPADHFDLVVVWHVLEHLPNPGEVLAEIRRILKPNGRIAVAVPNFSSWQAQWAGPAWFHLDLPRHLYHFSSDCLRRMLSDSGFEIDRERHFSLRQNPFGWVQSALNRWSPRNRNWLYSLLKRREPRSDVEQGRVGRWLQKLAYWAGMPVGLAVACVAAACRRGATVCLTGTMKPVSAEETDDALNAMHRANLKRLAAEHPECVAPARQFFGADGLESARR